jgi:alditol oxidase
MRNWAGNHEYRAARLLEPRSMEELQDAIAARDRVRVVGTRHSFNDIGDTEGDLISLSSMPRYFELDPLAGTLTVDAGSRYGELCQELDAGGWALENLPSLPHISVAGACLTGTHGSGDRHGVLATAIAGMELLTADGERHELSEGHGSDIPLEAAAVSLGCLGVVASITFRVEPRYRVRQDVYEHLPLDTLLEGFDAVMGVGDSVGCFLDWRTREVDQVWVKRRIPVDGHPEVPEALRGAVQAQVPLHPIRGMDADACTPQLGLPGPWHERWPHFQLSHTPSHGDELQSEYFVDRDDAPAALEAIWRLREPLSRLVFISEIRTIAQDELWLSPAHGRPTASFHFTWRPDIEAVTDLLQTVEAALAPFEPRAHWAKLSAFDAAVVGKAWPRAAEFQSLRNRLDPDERFRNAWTDRILPR